MHVEYECDAWLCSLAKLFWVYQRSLFHVAEEKERKRPVPTNNNFITFALLKRTRLRLLTAVTLLPADAQNALAMAQEKERAATEKLTEVSSRCAALEASNSQLRQEKALLTAQLESNRRRIEMLEDRRAR